jgi:hypothetical protein
VERKACNTYDKGKKPVGCMEDPSWDAFTKYGWHVRFLDDFLESHEKVMTLTLTH